MYPAEQGVVNLFDPFNDLFAGNLPIYTILYQGHYELRVDLEDWEGIRGYAKYWYFKIGGPLELYKITVAGYSGDAGILSKIIIVTFRAKYYLTHTQFPNEKEHPHQVCFLQTA